ncbi:MAG: Cys-tRNA(Pro) deacylase [Propionibacteriaceae bacterium]|nr:Cys-tRNA(Pro) deacylase [Propionibacteriaceae bacterium]
MGKKSGAAPTPAIQALDASGIAYTLHEFEHDPRSMEGFGREGATKLGIDPARIFKTLMARVDAALVCAVVPVAGMLDLKALAGAIGGKKAQMADPQDAERATGYVVGGISPLGQRRACPTVIDESVLAFDTVMVSGGRRGLDIELSPADLVHATSAQLAPIAR